MKKTIFLAFGILLSMVLITSCSKDSTSGGGTGGTGTGGTGTTPDSLKVTLSSSTIEFNGFDYVTITVKDKTGADVTSTSNIYAFGSIVSNKFIPNGLGNTEVYATKGTIPSDRKALNVITATPSPFSRKTIVEDITGAWCGFCTRISNKLELYKATKPNCIVVGVHGGGGTDPYKYQYYTNMYSAFSATGYPHVTLGRREKWNENNSVLDAELGKYAPLGLSIESAVSGTNVTGKVKVKYNVTTDQNMKIVVYLVENGLVYPQTNYYSPTGGYTPHLYGGQNPVTNFVHDGVLRRAATDIFGDAIPNTVQTKNNIWEFNYTIPLSGVTSSGASYTASSSNSRIVAFVVDASLGKGVHNAQSVAVGSTQNFD